MGLFDWIGPLNAGGKRRGWDALPAVPAVPAERKSWYIDDHRAIVVSPLVHGPGLSDRPASDGNSAVFACLQVIATAIAEPPLRVYRTSQAGDRVEQPGTPLAELLARPNPHLTLATLLAFLSNCLHIDGNAYWRKLRAGNPDTGNVVELWPISPSRIHPRTERGSGDYISYYRYYVRPGQYEDIPVDNIVHFRYGLDDRDHRLGCAPLKRLAREVSSDDQATRYADRLLANFAAPGLSLIFDKDTESIDETTAEALKKRIQAAYAGDNIGAVSVLSPGAKLESHGFSPEQMDMKTLHRVPEERIAAVLGVPAIVAGLGAGLDRSTYSNFAEAREAFTEMKLVPLWHQIGEAITHGLVPNFTSERGVDVAFNIDDVRALQDDQNAKAVRLKTYVEGGIITINEARADTGHELLTDGDVLLLPSSAVPTPADQLGLADEARQALANPGQTAAEQRSRPRILPLPARDEPPPIKGYIDSRLEVWAIERKALDDLPGAFERLREDQEPDWEDALRTFLAAQLARATRILRAGGDTADQLIVEGEAELLGELLTPRQLSLLDAVHRLVVGELGVAFDLDDAATRAYLSSAGSNIAGITQTTREAVRAALTEGQAAGEGIPELAARLRQLSEFGPKRAVTIARTELGHAANSAALADYRASSVVVGVRVFDGDYDAVCQAMNGRVFALDHAPATLQHPRCRRAFAPIVDASELERSA